MSKKIRDAHLPMCLCENSELDIINNSDLEPFQRDIAVRYLMATTLIESVEKYSQDDLTKDIVKPVFSFLESDLGKEYIATNTVNPEWTSNLKERIKDKL